METVLKRLRFVSETPVRGCIGPSAGPGGDLTGRQKAVRQPETKENGRNMDS